MIGKWSEWRPFPDPAKGESLTAPFGPGCYELRHGAQSVCCGKSKNVAYRMSSLLPEPVGAGTRYNKDKPRYGADHLAAVEYRTVATETEQEAAAVEREIRAHGKYLFPT